MLRRLTDYLALCLLEVYEPEKIALLVLSHPFAPIAQGIEHRPPEAGAQVRFLLGARRLLKTGEHVRT